MILSIYHVADWRYISQCKKTQLDNNIIQENDNIIDHDYRVGYKLMTQTKSAFKQKTTYRGTYKLVETWTNVNVTLIMGAVTTKINIHDI